MVARYLQQQGGGEYRPAPPEVCTALGFAGGIVMISGQQLDKNKVANSSPRKKSLARRDGEEDDDVSRMTNEEADEEEDDDVFNEGVDDHLGLVKRIADLEQERDKCKLQNADLQKKVAALLVRLGRDQGTRGSDANAEGEATQTAENIAEKESHLMDTLLSIQEGRAKLSRQQKEFDQLALDLQTRLDDKEFRASEIAESFRAFKQYVKLLFALNIRQFIFLQGDSVAR